MRLLFVTLFATLLTISAKSQNVNCDNIKRENDYLKNALKFQHDTGLYNFITSDKFQVKLTNVLGDKKNRTITLYFTATNKGSRKNFWNFYLNRLNSKIIDMNGNEITSPEINVGKKGQTSSDLESNIPVKCWFTFYDVIEDIPYIKKVALKYDDNEYWELNNLKVEWK